MHIFSQNSHQLIEQHECVDKYHIIL